MRIIKIIEKKKPFVSLEFFPPKDKTLWPGFFSTVNKLKKVDPAYVSVTYGAFGSTHNYTKEITIAFKKDLGLEPMAHLTCVNASKARIVSFLDQLNSEGVDNVLALRGDLPENGQNSSCSGDFHYASDLVAFVRNHYPSMGIAVAGYPEGHPDSENSEDDIAFLKFKCDQGADFILTQMFFDNSFYWDFVAKARAAGIDKPIIPGILPVATVSGLERMLAKDCASVPDKYMSRLREADRSGGKEAVRALGTEYAIAQAKELLQSGVPGIHFYTLNRAGTCLEIFDALGLF